MDDSVPLNMGVAGAGVFGGYHAAKIAARQDAALTRIFDTDPARAAARAAEYDATPHANLAIFLRGLDAVVVATPATTHAKIAMAALEAGVHVLVEKPIALSLPDADALIDLADHKGLVLQVGHQERYVAQALGLLDRPGITHVGSRRLNAPSGRAGDVSVVMDLMIHDLDLLGVLTGTDDAAITECEAKGPPGGPADHVSVSLRIGAITADLTASRLATVPVRDLKLDTRDGPITLDFLTRTVTNETKTPLSAQLGEGPALSDPLGYGTSLFRAAVRNHQPPKVSGRDGRAALRLALAIEHAVRDAL